VLILIAIIILILVLLYIARRHQTGTTASAPARVAAPELVAIQPGANSRPRVSL
jgi:hypothetical protein